MNAPSPRSGFTLVELSIVLVIIGILVGGGLAGQDLIRSAKLRAQLKQMENYHTAVNTFRMRFDGLPGDITNATSLFLASEWPGIANGNGDERVNDEDGVYTDLNGEITQFWMQLSAARQIEGSFTDTARVGQGFPKNELGKAGIIAVYDAAWQKGNVFYIGITDAPNPGSNDRIRGIDALTPIEASKIDDKLDDGHPYFGKVLARAEGSSYNTKPAYFDAHRLSMPAFYAQLLMDAFIPAAYAGAVIRTNACTFMDDDLPTPEEEEQAASYAISETGVNCQLSVVIE